MDLINKSGSPHGIVADVLDCDMVVHEFEIQLCCYIHFWTNTLGKDMNPLSSWLWFKLYHCQDGFDMPLNWNQNLINKDLLKFST